MIADALLLRVSDSVNTLLSERVQLIQSQQLSQYKSFSNLLKLSELKYEKQKENTGYMEKLAMSYKSERDYYQKREKKQRRKKNIVTYGGLILLGLIIVK